MKPTFKTTALAILISLGAVACGSSGGGNSSSSNNGADKTEKALSEQLKQSQKTVKNTQEKLSQAQQDLKKAQQQSVNANNAVKQAEKDVQKAKAEISQLKSQQTQSTTEKNNQIKDLEAKTLKIENELKTAQENAKNAKVALDAAIKAKDDAEKTALLAQKTAEQAKQLELTAKKDKEKAVKQAEKEVAQAQDQLQAARKKAEEAKVQADEAKKAKEYAQQLAEKAKQAQLNAETEKSQAMRDAEEKVKQAEKSLADAQTKTKEMQAQLSEMEKQAKQKEEALKTALADAKKWENKVPAEIRQELERTKDFIFITRFRKDANTENFSTLPTKTANGDLRDFLFLGDDTEGFKDYTVQEKEGEKIYRTYRYHEDNAYIAEVFYDDYQKSVQLYGGDATPAKALDTLKTKGEVTYDVHAAPGLGRNWDMFYHFVLKANFDRKTIHGQLTPTNERAFSGNIILNETSIKTDNDILSFNGNADFYQKDNRHIDYSKTYQGIFVGSSAEKVIGQLHDTTFIGNATK